jgi:predicted PhzF superfamily epimerase YddE/YHI9
MNLSETAFVRPLAAPVADTAFAVQHTFGLRWFTPTREVDLCGHATLASAAVLFQITGEGGWVVVGSFRPPASIRPKTGNSSPTLTFKTLSGDLLVSKASGDSMSMGVYRAELAMIYAPPAFPLHRPPTESAGAAGPNSLRRTDPDCRG